MFRMRITNRAPLALAISVMLLGRGVLAQGAERSWSVGLAAGVAAQPDRQGNHLSRVGWHAATNLTAWMSANTGLRLEGLTSGFSEKVGHVHAPCPPDAEPTSCHEPVSAVRLTALTLGLIGGSGSGYASLGGGVYSLTDHPTDQGQTRMGVAATAGRTFGTRPKLALEVQLHWVPGVRLGGEWHAPLRLGLIW